MAAFTSENKMAAFTDICPVCDKKLSWSKKKNPSSRIWTSDLWMSDNVQLQSTALPTELSKETWNKMNLWRSSFWLSVFVLENLFTLLPTWKSFNNISIHRHGGGVAQMVERSLSMREVPGSIPGASKWTQFSHFSSSLYYEIKPPRNSSLLQTQFYNMVLNMRPLSRRT